MKSTEKPTQKAIIQYLTLKRKFFWRNNSGAFKTETGGFYSFGTPGSPDIFCIEGAICFGIEVKDLKGKQSPSQKEFQGKFERAGGKYILARSLGDVLEYL